MTFEQARTTVLDTIANTADQDPLAALTTIAALDQELEVQRQLAVRQAALEHSWAAIGEALGVTKQAAHQRYTKQWATDLGLQLKAAQQRYKTAQKSGTPAEASEARSKRDALIEQFKAMSRANKKR